ncbi:MAG TPA: site-specific integrase, partial [Casimicrobiaceae bacterium]|nr:site-specific integrase [Casimicrobiaceae bacterium]
LQNLGSQVPTLQGPGAAALPNAASPLLSAPVVLPRELRTDEIAALLASADEAVRLPMLLLFSGVDVQEAIALHGTDVDLEKNTLRIRGSSARELHLSEPLRTLLARDANSNDRLLWFSAADATEDAIDAQILSAAYDARLSSPAEVDAKCLRHTFIAFLVRQGIRFSDLQRIVGALPAQTLAGYALLSPTTSVQARDAIDPVLPAIRQATVV